MKVKLWGDFSYDNVRDDTALYVFDVDCIFFVRVRGELGRIGAKAPVAIGLFLLNAFLN